MTDLPAALPDAARLLALPAPFWAALRARLDAIGLDAACGRIREGDLPPLDAAARPLRLWKARRQDDPASLAYRCFVDADPVAEPDARRALEGLDLDAMLAAGLLACSGGRVVCPYELAPCGGMYLLGDPLARGGDAVMSWGQMTIELLRAASRPGGDAHLTRVLDLGCGAGTCALLLAERAERVIGCDINARAVQLARVNAIMNGVANAEFRQGDLSAPVAGELFDLIVSQPPFIPRHASAGEAAYLWGGSRGDELPLRALAEAAARLREGGRALFFVQWAVFDDEPVAARVRRAVADDHIDVLVLEARGQDLDGNSAGEASTAHPDLGPGYASAVVACREHYERLGIREFRHSIVVLRRRREGPAWTGTTRVGAFAEGRITGAHVDSLLQAHDLAARGKNAILDSRLRLPKGTGFVREEDDVRVVFPDGSLLAEARLGGDAHGLLSAVHEAGTVREAARRLAQQHRAPVEATTAAALPAITAALRAGVVVVAK